jgi:hypothetical protein
LRIWCKAKDFLHLQIEIKRNELSLKLKDVLLRIFCKIQQNIIKVPGKICPSLHPFFMVWTKINQIQCIFNKFSKSY